MDTTIDFHIQTTILRIVERLRDVPPIRNMIERLRERGLIVPPKLLRQYYKRLSLPYKPSRGLWANYLSHFPLHSPETTIRLKRYQRWMNLTNAQRHRAMVHLKECESIHRNLGKTSCETQTPLN